MPIVEIAKYTGAIGVSLIVILLIVRFFLKAMRGMQRDFTKIITNHLQHNDESSKHLSDAIIELITWLKKTNGHKK